mgnify:CR=1 FL=1
MEECKPGLRPNSRGFAPAVLLVEACFAAHARREIHEQCVPARGGSRAPCSDQQPPPAAFSTRFAGNAPCGSVDTRSTAERGARTPRLAPERVGVGPVVVFPEALPAVVPVQPDIVVQPNRSPPCRVVRSGHSVIRLDAQGHEQKLSSLSLDSSLVSSITTGLGHTAWRVQLSLTCVDCAAEARGRPSSSGGREVVNVLARPDSQRDAAAS